MWVLVLRPDVLFLVLQAMKRAKDTQEKSMCDTIARLQGDKATLLERNQQLESSLYQLSRRVRAASKVSV